MRLRKNSFTVRGEDDRPIHLTNLLNELAAEECLDLSAFATNLNGVNIPIRICAKRKTAEAISQTQRKLKRKESKNQIVISDETKAFNE